MLECSKRAYQRQVYVQTAHLVFLLLRVAYTNAMRLRFPSSAQNSAQCTISASVLPRRASGVVYNSLAAYFVSAPQHAAHASSRCICCAASTPQSQSASTTALATDSAVSSSDITVLCFAYDEDTDLARRCLDTMADALADDPSTSYFCWPGQGRAFYASSIRASAQEHPLQRQLYSVNGGDCAALCYSLPRPPSDAGEGASTSRLQPLMHVRWDRLIAGARYSELLEAYRERFGKLYGPFLYIQVTATRPGLQGRGLGSALLLHLLQQADAAGQWCYVEASSEANQRFYLRHGFERVTTVQLVDSCPPVFVMVRRPPGRKPSNGINGVK